MLTWELVPFFNKLAWFVGVPATILSITHMINAWRNPVSGPSAVYFGAISAICWAWILRGW